MQKILISAAFAAALFSAHAASPVALDIHGNSDSGINVHVKSITLHEDHTGLQIAVSFANPKRPKGIELAGHDTFLQTPSGDKLMLQRKGNDDTLSIANNANLEGDLNFQGALPKGSDSITLVLNDGRPSTHSKHPGFELAIPLPADLPATVQSVSRGLPENAGYPVQGNNGSGLLAHIKSVKSEGNTTRLNGTFAFSSLRRADGAKLGGAKTFLRVNGTLNLPLQAPADNPELLVKNHDVLSGELIFQGHIPADAQSLELVINDGRPSNHSQTPGLTLPLPLP